MPIAAFNPIDAARELGRTGTRRVCPFDVDTEKPLAEAWFKGWQDRYDNDPSIYIRHVGRPRGSRKIERRVAVIDLETDPFDGPGKFIAPFAAGFFDGETYTSWWGDDCVKSLVKHIRQLNVPYIIYAHNGGKFDYSFLLSDIEPQIFTIGNRIVRAYIRGDQNIPEQKDVQFYVHELRDSFSIVPVPLKLAADKFEFDYDKMKRGVRNRHKKIIEEYLEQDCRELYRVVSKYRETFGNALTMSSAAMKKLNESMAPPGANASFKAYDRLSEKEDERLRDYYFGGRVECFKKGLLHGDFKIYDINSSYPNVMRSYLHPVGAAYKRGMSDITDKTDFIRLDAESDGALPWRNPDTGKLDFPHGRREFFATGHEVRTALELGLLKIHRVMDAMECERRVSFAKFIDTYYAARKIARANNEPMFDLFWKLVMNGAYGKFAQNPRRFKDTIITMLDDPPPDPEAGWTLAERHEAMDVYTRPSSPETAWRSYLNVATGASITGAARAELLHGLSVSHNPVYCDTDSIISEDFHGNIDATTLGAWKNEAIGNAVAICERKLYAIFGERSCDPKIEAYRIAHYGDPYCIKIASKGVRMKAADILRVVNGETVLYTPLAPTIKLDGRQMWTNRRVKMAA